MTDRGLALRVGSVGLRSEGAAERVRLANQSNANRINWKWKNFGKFHCIRLPFDFVWLNSIVQLPFDCIWLRLLYFLTNKFVTKFLQTKAEEVNIPHKTVADFNNTLSRYLPCKNLLSGISPLMKNYKFKYCHQKRATRHP